MPLSVNIGLSKKMSRDFQSTGVSVALTAELDATLLTKPDELQNQIDQLYGQAEQALNRQAERLTPGNDQPLGRGRGDRYSGRRSGDVAAGGPAAGTRYDNGGGGRQGNGPSGGTSPMTQSQRRAINAIATRLGTDPHLEASDVIGVELERLTLREASELIDHLKGISPAAGGNGGGGGGGDRRNGGGR